MASCTCEQRELMKIFKCVIDTGNEVLSAFFDLKVLSLPKYGGNFTQFLEHEKHFLYHQWEQKRTMCCACPKVGCSIRRIQKMDTWIFQKLYQANGIEDPAHVIRHGGCIQQLCLHKFVTRNIAAHELDISVLSFFLRIFASMSASENTSLDTVTLCRSSICHSWSTKCFPMAELSKMWTDLETHLVNLSEARYRRIVQKQIQALRKLEIDREEIAELSNHINYLKEVVEDLNHNVNTNNNAVVSACVAKFEKLYTKDSNRIQKIVSDQSLAIKQAQEEVVSVVKYEAHDFKENLSKTKEEMMTKMSKLEHAQDIPNETTDVIWIDEKENQPSVFTQEDIAKNVPISINEVEVETVKEKLIQKFDNVVFELKYDKPVKRNSTEEIAMKECAVLWHLETPSEWNEKEVAEALKDVEGLTENLEIKIKFVRYGSLIILTTVPYDILHDQLKYEHAIKMFLTRMIDICNINTEIACRVKATLHILRKNEVCIHPAYGLCEDKSTQMSISQEDKCLQVNSSYFRKSSCEFKLQKEQESKTIFNESDDVDQYEPRYLNGQRRNSSHGGPCHRRSSRSYDLLFQGFRSSKSETNIYGNAPEMLSRTHSACSNRSFDSSYGSHKSSYTDFFCKEQRKSDMDTFVSSTSKEIIDRLNSVSKKSSTAEKSCSDQDIISKLPVSTATDDVNPPYLEKLSTEKNACADYDVISKLPVSTATDDVNLPYSEKFPTEQNAFSEEETCTLFGTKAITRDVNKPDIDYRKIAEDIYNVYRDAGNLSSGRPYLGSYRADKRPTSASDEIPKDLIFYPRGGNTSTVGGNLSTGRPVRSHQSSKKRTSAVEETPKDLIFYPDGGHPCTGRPSVGSHRPATTPISVLEDTSKVSSTSPSS